MSFSRWLVTVTIVLGATGSGTALSQTAKSYPLGYTIPAGAKWEVEADLNSDGMMDRALLAFNGDKKKIGLWVISEDGQSWLLSHEEATLKSRSAVLTLGKSGDPSCPIMDRQGRRDCRRSWGMGRYASFLIVQYANGEAVSWTWNGRSFTREEMFR